MNYYKVKGYLSNSYLKKLRANSTGAFVPPINPVILAFGQEVDELLTGRTKPICEYSPKAIQLAMVYKRHNLIKGERPIYQKAYYGSVTVGGITAPYKGLIDVEYPISSIVEDIKTAGLASKTPNAIRGFIRTFGYHAQIAGYMELTGCKNGVLSIISKKKHWLHQELITEGTDLYHEGREVLTDNVKFWHKSGQTLD